LINRIRHTETICALFGTQSGSNYHQQRKGHNIIHFASAKKHIGIYPGTEAVEHFADELKNRGLKFSKGAIQIPYGDHLPLDLIAEIARWCGEHNGCKS
jgi:uncharacterized protein YdhG (YjbR/CyaY superfamily)